MHVSRVVNLRRTQQNDDGKDINGQQKAVRNSQKEESKKEK
jgi:hypothetical protein